MTMHAQHDGASPRVSGTDDGLDVRIRRRIDGFTLDVAFATGRGITALLGPSGAGKTLTLRAIAGLLRPDEGRIVLHGQPLFDAATGVDVPTRARGVGYVFQQYAVFPHMSVEANVGYGLHAMPRTLRGARVMETLDIIGLSEYAARMPQTLSGGQLQRVALARAIAPSPRVLLLDEPLAALDAPLRQRLGAELRGLHERTRIPMVLVTHDPDEAARIADSVVMLTAGRLVTEASPAVLPE